MRAYTPTSSDDELGYFDLVIKVPIATCTDPLKSSLSCRNASRSNVDQVQVLHIESSCFG